MERSLAPTWIIGPKAAQTNYYVEMHAARIGLPLTHLLTIDFALTRLEASPGGTLLLAVAASPPQ